MARPGATVSLSNGNLGLQPISSFGTPVLVLSTPIAPAAGYLTAFSVKSKAQVATAFGQVGNEAVLTALRDGFYKEAPEGKELFIVAASNTNQFVQLAAEAIAGKALDLANGKARLVAFVKFPAGAYTPTITNGFDQDVHDSATLIQTLADSWFTKRKPFRAIIQGYGFTNATAAKDYSSDSKRNVLIVVGAVNDSSAMATLLALGRASQAEPQQNIGRVKNGSLAIAENATVKLGATLIDLIPSVDLDTLHTKRYVTFEKNEIAPGYVWSDDNMLVKPDDDFNNLRYGQVIDNAVRVAYQAYYEELKDDVNVDENGRLDPVVEKALETKVESAIDNQMRSQLSLNNGIAAVECLVNPDPILYATLYVQNGITNPNFNIIQSNTVYIFVRLRPKGCLKYINIYLGYTATT